MKTYHYLWRLILYRPWLYLLNGIIWLMIHVFPLIPGLIIQQIFNALPQAGHLDNTLWLLVIFLVATTLAQVVLAFLGVMVDIQHRFSIASVLRRNMLASILQRPGSRSLPDAPGEALNRLRDDPEQAENAVSWTLDTIAQIIFALVAIVILFQVNALITILIFFPLAGVVALAKLLKNRLERYRQVSRSATGRVSGAIGEIFSMVQAIRIAGAEQRVLDHFQGLNEKRRTAMLRDRLLEQLLTSTFSNVVGLGTGFILLLAASSIQAGQLKLGDLALFIYYLDFVADFTLDIGNFLAHYTQTNVAFQRMEKLLQGAPSAKLVEHHPLYVRGPLPELPIPAPVSEKLVALEVENLTYHHPESGRGISNVNFTLQPGQLTVITGRIGSGKTTLLQTLLGLLPKASGHIRWNGQEVNDPANFFVPPHSSYTPQVPRLFSTTLKENILLGLPEERTDIQTALHTAVMEQDLITLEQGLETVVGTRGVKLSGGQAQRTAAARMFVRNTQLLVFDDLSSALDVETERTLWTRLFERRQNACLVVSHRRAVLQRADHIIVLKGGHLEAEGTLDDLLEHSAEMQRLWHGDITD